MRIGSLFTGVGGLDGAVEAAFDAETVWVSEVEPAACAVIEHRFPGVPNLGDVTRINWDIVPPVDIITGGSPCQDLSHAGRRAGMTEGTRSNLWVAMREGIAHLKPTFVVWENVRGAYSAAADSDLGWTEGLLDQRSPDRLPQKEDRALRALGRVLGDLSDLGYDAQWRGLRAADVGACHQRFRVFLLAWRRDAAAHDARGRRGHEAVEHDGRGASAVDWAGVSHQPDRHAVGAGSELHYTDFGQYAAAVARHEQALGRPAPAPTEPGRNGNPLLAARFVEWMMMLPDGWITDVPGVTRNEALRMAGNGVVPSQALAALREMLYNPIMTPLQDRLIT